MFLRLLFALLLALNLGVAGWLVFGDTAHPVPLRTQPGVAELRLLSEQAGTPEERSAELSEAPRKAPDAGDQCYALGPFQTQADVRQVLDALGPQVANIQFRQEQTTKSRGWWVYLPALPSRQAALDAARKLSSMGVSDYYVVTAGEHQNTVSLGLFHNPDNARHRRKAIAELGFKPSLRERTEQVAVFYVDYAIPVGTQLDWQTYLPKHDHAKSHKRVCF